MKLIGMKIENLRKINCAELDFNGENFVKIKGGTEGGKTTILDSIRYLFKSRLIPAGAVTDGEKESFIEGTFNNCTIGRKIRPDGTTKSLSISPKESMGDMTPQAFLDDVFGKFCDPVKMMEMKEKDLLKMVLDNAGLDLLKHDINIENLENERLQLTRDIKSLGEPVEVEKAETTNTNELIEKREEITQFNNTMRERKTAQERINIELSQINEEITRLKKKHDKYVDEFNSIPEPEEEKSTEEIEKQINSVDENNKKATAYERYIEHKGKHKNLTDKRKAKTDEIEKERQVKKEKIKEVELPEGMKIVDDSLHIGCASRDNWSTSQSVKAHAEIALMLSGDLKILFIDRAESLGSKKTAELIKIAEENEAQIIATFVDETYKFDGETIWIKEGEVL
jgi:DNA repair ATPase RecN